MLVMKLPLGGAVGAALVAAMFSSPASAQGFPTIDVTAIANSLQQLRQMQEQYTTQLEELATSRDALTQIEDQLLAMTGVSDFDSIMGDLDALGSVDLSETMGGVVDSIISGDMSGPNSANMTQTLGLFDVSGLDGLVASDEPMERGTAQFTGVAVASIAEGQAGHASSQVVSSRAESLADGVGSQESLKEAIDYNSLILAEIASNQAVLIQLLSASLVNDGTSNMMAARSALSQNAFRVRNAPDLE